MIDNKQQHNTARYELPLTYTRTVQKLFNPRMGNLTAYFIEIEFPIDGSVDVKPGDRVRVTVEKVPPSKVP
jgi:hypothetical protein